MNRNKMSKYVFYSHLIEMDSVIIELEKMDLSESERKHLTSLIDSSLHHTILDIILSELSDSDKRMFLTRLTHEDNLNIWKFLNERVEKIEDKIKKAADQLKEELHDDIKKAHNLKR